MSWPTHPLASLAPGFRMGPSRTSPASLLGDSVCRWRVLEAELPPFWLLLPLNGPEETSSRRCCSPGGHRRWSERLGWEAPSPVSWSCQLMDLHTRSPRRATTRGLQAICGMRGRQGIQPTPPLAQEQPLSWAIQCLQDPPPPSGRQLATGRAFPLCLSRLRPSEKGWVGGRLFQAKLPPQPRSCCHCPPLQCWALIGIQLVKAM